jgi:hypothetical protein
MVRLGRATSCDFQANAEGQTCFGSRGVFWPMRNPLFQGRLPLTGRKSLRCSTFRVAL